jgi:hypothetical protein
VNRRDAVITLAGLLLALAFLGIDSARRIALVDTVAGSANPTTAPQTDPSSPTGYAHNQHQVILPSGGADGYHWIMQTEQMLAGDGVRVRSVSYDNAPDGREVHWSGSVRWWLAGVAWAYQRFHPELQQTVAVARVASWVIPLALALLLIVLVPVLARRLGAVAAALCSFGFVLVQPIYQYWTAGFLDHHAFATMSCFTTILFLIAGGAGWVRADAGGATGTWSERSATRWFVASGVSGGIGLWISAATIVPALIASGIAAGVSMLLLHPNRAEQSVQPAPVLWRQWGIAGCVTSVALYLLEYFPSHLGMRLEVNHPLYALAWLGAGDFLYRLAHWSAQRAAQPAADTRRGRAQQSNEQPLPWPWLARDAAAVLLLPLIVLLTTESTFKVADTLLWSLHADYILEFMNLGRQFAPLRLHHMMQIVLPIVLLPVAGLLWPTSLSGNARRAWRALVIFIAGVGAAFMYGLLFYALQHPLRALDLLGGSQAALIVAVLALICDALVVAAFAVWPARGAQPLAVHAQAALLLAVLPTAAVLLLAFQQVRWLGVACTLGLAAMITVAAVTTQPASGFVWSRARRSLAAVLLLMILLPMPFEAVFGAWRYGYPPRVAAHQLVARDVAHTLRQRLGAREGVVLSSPTVTSWLIYFGGLRGIGTLYWENVEGLKAAARIYGAPNAQVARELFDRHGITHMVIDFGEPFVREYARLSRGQRGDVRDPLASPRDAFALQMIEQNAFPDWLRVVPYTPPAIRGVQTQPVLILEVVR